MDSSAFQKPQAPKKQHSYTNDGVMEALRGLGSGVGKTVTHDIAGKMGSDALASLFGTPPAAGEMRANESVNLSRETARPTMRRPEFNLSPRMHTEDAQIKQQIESVRQELKALAASVQSLNSEIKRAVMEVPVDPGIYHVNFFDRLRSMLKIIREQIDDSRSWLNLSSGRKQKKGYWGMYKKHGTTFGLSNERSLATQAG